MTLSFEEAKALLSTCTRSELRDHAFGDREIYFEDAAGNAVAEGYSGSGDVSIEISGSHFVGIEAQQLILLGHVGAVERNDSSGPDEYVDGKVTPGLTIGGVFDELCNEE